MVTLIAYVYLALFPDSSSLPKTPSYISLYEYPGSSLILLIVILSHQTMDALDAYHHTLKFDTQTDRPNSYVTRKASKPNLQKANFKSFTLLR